MGTLTVIRHVVATQHSKSRDACRMSAAQGLTVTGADGMPAQRLDSMGEPRTFFVQASVGF